MTKKAREIPNGLLGTLTVARVSLTDVDDTLAAGWGCVTVVGMPRHGAVAPRAEALAWRPR